MQRAVNCGSEGGAVAPLMPRAVLSWMSKHGKKDMRTSTLTYETIMPCNSFSVRNNKQYRGSGLLILFACISCISTSKLYCHWSRSRSIPQPCLSHLIAFESISIRNLPSICCISRQSKYGGIAPYILSINSIIPHQWPDIQCRFCAAIPLSLLLLLSRLLLSQLLLSLLLLSRLILPRLLLSRPRLPRLRLPRLLLPCLLLPCFLPIPLPKLHSHRIHIDLRYDTRHIVAIVFSFSYQYRRPCVLVVQQTRMF
jgi:hypothetical protein